MNSINKHEGLGYVELRESWFFGNNIPKRRKQLLKVSTKHWKPKMRWIYKNAHFAFYFLCESAGMPNCTCAKVQVCHNNIFIF